MQPCEGMRRALGSLGTLGERIPGALSCLSLPASAKIHLSPGPPPGHRAPWYNRGEPVNLWLARIGTLNAGAPGPGSPTEGRQVVLAVGATDWRSMQQCCVKIQAGTAGQPPEMATEHCDWPFCGSAIPQLCHIMLSQLPPQGSKSSRLSLESILTVVLSEWEDAELMCYVRHLIISENPNQ